MMRLAPLEDEADPMVIHRHPVADLWSSTPTGPVGTHLELELWLC
jgi:hypothetical protein